MRELIETAVYTIAIAVLVALMITAQQLPAPPQNVRIEGTVTVVNETHCTIEFRAGNEQGPWLQATIPLEGSFAVPRSVFQQAILRVRTLCP